LTWTHIRSLRQNAESLSEAPPILEPKRLGLRAYAPSEANRARPPETQLIV
jgi:hypothetical protein